MSFRIRIKKTEIFFRHWSRKKYAVFASLKRIIKICTLIITYTLLNKVNPVSAQKDTIYFPPKADLEEVEIIGHRAPGVYSDLARVVAVITKDELDCAPVQSLNDLLEYIPGVDIRQRGILGVQADLSIRGGSFDQTLILINGIPYNDPQTGHHNLNLPVDFNSIEKIEILEGPGSRVYGANAFSGAINIITGTQKINNLKVSINAGQHSYLSTGISAHFSYRKFSNFVSITRTGTAGYIDNTDFKNLSGYYNGAMQSRIGTFELQAGYINKAFGANSFYTAKYPEQFEQIKSSFLALKYSTGDVVKSRFYFAWRRHHDRFELFREDRYTYSDGYFIKGNDTAVYSPGIYEQWNYYPGHNYHLTDVLISGINTSIPSRLGLSSVGIEYKSEHIFSNVLGTLMDSPKPVEGETRGEYTRSDQRETLNVYAEHSKRLKTFYFSGGLLGSYIQDNGFKIFLGGEISKQILLNNKLFFSVNQSLRMPTFTDLYYNGPSNVGNPDLKPERALTFEGGFQKSLKIFHLRISAFNRYGKDIIDWVKLPEDAKYTTRNYTRLNTWGFEFNSSIIPTAISRINFINLDYNFINSDKYSDEYISAYALDYLKHKLTARISNRLYKSVNLTWNLSLQKRNGSYTDINLQEQDYKIYFLAGAKLNRKSKYTELYIEASNLFNVKYRDYGSIIQPGRWIFAGIKLNLDFDSDR